MAPAAGDLTVFAGTQEAAAHAASLAADGAPADEAARGTAAEAALLRPAEALLRTLQRMLARAGPRPLRELVAGVDWQVG